MMDAGEPESPFVLPGRGDTPPPPGSAYPGARATLTQPGVLLEAMPFLVRVMTRPLRMTCLRFEHADWDESLFAVAGPDQDEAGLRFRFEQVGGFVARFAVVDPDQDWRKVGEREFALEGLVEELMGQGRNTSYWFDNSRVFGPFAGVREVDAFLIFVLLQKPRRHRVLAILRHAKARLDRRRKALRRARERRTRERRAPSVSGGLLFPRPELVPVPGRYREIGMDAYIRFFRSLREKDVPAWFGPVGFGDALYVVRLHVAWAPVRLRLLAVGRQAWRRDAASLAPAETPAEVAAFIEALPGVEGRLMPAESVQVALGSAYPAAALTAARLKAYHGVSRPVGEGERLVDEGERLVARLGALAGRSDVEWRQWVLRRLGRGFARRAALFAADGAPPHPHEPRRPLSMGGLGRGGSQTRRRGRAEVADDDPRYPVEGPEGVLKPRD